MHSWAHLLIYFHLKGINFLSSRIIPWSDPDHCKWGYLKICLKSVSSSKLKCSININEPHKSLCSRALEEQHTIYWFALSFTRLLCSTSATYYAAWGWVQTLGSAGYDWLFNELLAILKCYFKAGIVHDEVSALFMKVYLDETQVCVVNIDLI